MTEVTHRAESGSSGKVETMTARMKTVLSVSIQLPNDASMALRIFIKFRTDQVRDHQKRKTSSLPKRHA